MNAKRLAKEGLVVARRKPFKSIKVFYNSAEPPRISYERALEILDNQQEWENLNLGKKLNVIKVYSRGIAKELDIPVPPIHLADFNSFRGRILVSGRAFSIKDGFCLNIKQLKNVYWVRRAIAHETKHIYQFHVIDGEYKPKTLPAQEVIDEWKKSFVKRADGTFCRNVKSISEYFNSSIENDAFDFQYKYVKKVFGEDIEKKRRGSIRKRMTDPEKKLQDILDVFSPQTKVDCLNEWKANNICTQQFYDENTKKLKKKYPNLHL